MTERMYIDVITASTISSITGPDGNPGVLIWTEDAGYLITGDAMALFLGGKVTPKQGGTIKDLVRSAAEFELKELEPVPLNTPLKKPSNQAIGRRSTKGQYSCPECDRVFTYPQSLGSHRGKKHGVLGQTVEQRLKAQRAARRARIIADTPKDQLAYCDVCLEPFQSAKSLKAHKSAMSQYPEQHVPAHVPAMPIAKPTSTQEVVELATNSTSSSDEPVPLTIEWV